MKQNNQKIHRSIENRKNAEKLGLPIHIYMHHLSKGNIKEGKLIKNNGSGR